MHIFQCMGKIFCVEFQRVPLKFHTKYLTQTLKDTILIQRWNFKSSWIHELISVVEMPPPPNFTIQLWVLLYSHHRTNRYYIHPHWGEGACCTNPTVHLSHPKIRCFGTEMCTASLYWNGSQGAVSIRKTVLPGMAIPMLKIRRPNGRLIFNMEIAIRR